METSTPHLFISCLSLLFLGLYHCYTVTMSWQKQQLELQLAAAVRQALAMSLVHKEKMVTALNMESTPVSLVLEDSQWLDQY